MAFCTKCGRAADPNATFCRACGTALPAAASGVAPGVAAAPAAARKSNTGLKIVFILLAIFISLPIVGGMIYSVVTGIRSADKADNTESKSPDEDCPIRAASFLEMLKRDDSGYSDFWKPGTRVIRLYDVRSYKELTHGPFLQPNGKPFKNPRAYYKFEVESSTKGGFPIIKRWAVVMEPASTNAINMTCAIVDMVEAE
jgi:zinc-ribbon domain